MGREKKGRAHAGSWGRERRMDRLKVSWGERRKRKEQRESSEVHERGKGRVCRREGRYSTIYPMPLNNGSLSYIGGSCGRKRRQINA